jgi:aryl-alcohol dehydrogenase-like predicted oxidoreductase
MQTRIFGRTGHASTLAIFGAAAFWKIEQSKANVIMERVLGAGVNHIDVAPSYGEAEIRLGPFIRRHRDDFFLGCKTMERTRQGASAELRQSLVNLQTDRFDLYQFHAVNTMGELDAIFSPGGALEAVLEARQQGLTRFIGITGHGVDAPAIYLEALRRFDFDSVLFPINFVQYANPVYRRSTTDLLAECARRKVGVMAIKSITRGPWREGQEHTHTTWYEPFHHLDEIQSAVNFALSQEITGLCTAGDITVLPLMLEAIERFSALSDMEQEALIDSAVTMEPLFA